MSFIYSTCLGLDSYNKFDEHKLFDDLIRRYPSKFRYEHEHRKWEYGLALKYATEISPRTVLNVGGGNSPLSTALLSIGADVTEIDPSNVGQERLPGIHYLFDKFPTENLGKYDMVVCTSVIEHVESDIDFYEGLLKHANTAVFLTTDFHPSGNRMSESHIRTYTKAMLDGFIKRARFLNFVPYGEVDYAYTSPMVHNYTFASLALKRDV